MAKDMEALEKRRTRIMAVLGALLIVFGAGALQAGMSISVSAHPRNVDIVRFSAFFAMAAVVVVRFLSGLRFGRAAEDELTRWHRARAVQLGYVLLLIGAGGAVLVSLFQPLSLIEVAPALVVLGVSAPLIRFALLERAAEPSSDG